jgi:hypothetical protein
MSKGRTWYVVADGGEARVLTLDGSRMRTLESFDNSGHGDTDQDPSARTSQSNAPKLNPHDQAKEHFAKQVAAKLNEAVRTDLYPSPRRTMMDQASGIGRILAQS